MDHIQKAIELAEGSLGAGAQRSPMPGAPSSSASQIPLRKMDLNKNWLESQRVVSFNNVDPRSRAFDILRTQVLQSMNAKNWQSLAVTSPTSDCGKTLTAVNLALSIARKQETTVVLVDLDLQKPRIARSLGIKPEQGVMGVLEGRIKLSDAMVQACIGNQSLMVLPCESATPSSSEWMSSRAMTSLLQELRRSYRASIIIIDLPPILPSDDVISILPQIDCVLFVTAVGTTTKSDIVECNKYLQSAPLVKVVLNKTSELGGAYHYY